ncbi:hypothetical protein SteCoe_12726 [Stentor coeruleus]|uniref:Protein SEY1 homolog n=1 Tax=Stentor coeruleus TaxID=5963 RepID=A0A1R2CA56_9CILI|nr:hypothetical protein SteCoe_12726 [Stentor coeruleus]
MAMNSVQIVTFEGDITNEAKILLEASPLQSTDYHTVAIIGCQSTGKSTLLNMLFETNFDTLDSMKGRNQTTKGIHLAYNLSCKCLVIDIEGTDSQIRGDDGAAFEQMSALFALAISDVLMVNMWTSEIGRYKAASVGLLKTIFEVNLKLFGQEGKKRILFILRDFNDGVNNLGILKQQISKTMEEIWEKIKKPSHLTLCNVFDCFEFDFHTISSKDFKPEEFKREVGVLKDKFSDSNRNDWLFRYKNNDVPIDGVPLYYTDIWSTIHSDKDLNIPSQKEMLANLRCNELKMEAIKEFQNNVLEISKNIGRVVVDNLAGKFSELYEKSLIIYDEHASGYYENTYRKTRDELIEMLMDQSKDLFHIQMKYVSSQQIHKAKDMLLAKLPKSVAVENFSEIVNEIFTMIKNEFMIIAEGSLVTNSGWDISEYNKEIEDYLYDRISEEKEKQKNHIIAEYTNAFGSKFTSEIGKILDQAMDHNIWEKVKNVQIRVCEPLELRIEKVLKNAEMPSETVHKMIVDSRMFCIQTIKTKIEKFSKNLEDYLMKKFSILFNKDEKGVPRDPKTTNYEEVFSISKSRVLPVLEQFRYFMLSTDWDRADDGNHSEILSEEEYEKIMESFLRDAERAYKDAQHIKEFGYNRGGLPKWAILIIVLLGWNEFLWILRSPLVLYPGMFVGSVVALMFSMGLGAVPKLIFSQAISRIPFLF